MSKWRTSQFARYFLTVLARVWDDHPFTVFDTGTLDGFVEAVDRWFPPWVCSSVFPWRRCLWGCVSNLQKIIVFPTFACSAGFKNSNNNNNNNGEARWLSHIGIRVQNLAIQQNFYSLSVSLWNDLTDPVFDSVGLSGFKSRANAFFHWSNLLYLYYCFHQQWLMMLLSPYSSDWWCCPPPAGVVMMLSSPYSSGWLCCPLSVAVVMMLSSPYSSG